MTRLAGVLCLLAFATAARAECDQAVAASEAAALREALTAESERLRSWKLTWTTIFVGGVISQVAIGGFFEGDERRTFDVGAIKAGLGALTTPFLAPSIRVPAESGSACQDVVHLRAAAAYAARREARGVAWFQHLPGAAVNVAGILYLGLAHDLWVESLLGAAFGTLVGEIKLYTQPTRAIGWGKSGAIPTDSPWIGSLRIGAGPGFFLLRFAF